MTADPTPALARFVRELPGALDALRSAVQAAGRPELLPLDLSYASLDRLEDYYRLRLEAPASGDELKRLRDQLPRYIGATLIERAGGAWALRGTDPPEPVVTRVPGVKGRDFEPLGPVLDFKRLRSPGWLRDATERWDLAARRHALAALVARIDAEIAELRRDVEQLTGTRLQVLDGSPDALAAVERALRRLVEIGAPRDQRRQVRQRAVLLLGSVMAAALGGGEWSVCDEAANADFGELTIRGWAPSNALRIGAKTRPDHLALSLASEIEARRR